MRLLWTKMRDAAKKKEDVQEALETVTASTTVTVVKNVSLNYTEQDVQYAKNLTENVLREESV